MRGRHRNAAECVLRGFDMSRSGTSSPNVDATSVRIAAISSVGPD
ncbi:hypothetical protein BSFP_050980 [Burkholderia stabilis]|uniref:Uncharacterized protein n=1 Tax=Burkholderia stabilis TaxID=95485 RepID=A0A1Y1BQQ3_9BURK|nr:hypothetical protein BSFP_050980 [Burkholderia stabilis]